MIEISNRSKESLEFFTKLLTNQIIQLPDLPDSELKSCYLLTDKIYQSSLVQTSRTKEDIFHSVHQSKQGDLAIAQICNHPFELNDESITKDRSYDLSISNYKIETKHHPFSSNYFSLTRNLNYETICMLWNRIDIFICWKSYEEVCIPWFAAVPEIFASKNRNLWTLRENGSGFFSPINKPGISILNS